MKKHKKNGFNVVRTGCSLIAMILFSMIILVSCGEKESKTPPALTLETLKNAAYRTEWLDDGAVTLADGTFRKPYMEGSASALVITLLPDMHAFGDLDGDSVEDAAVVLATSGGGSGTFISLEAVINENGSPRHAATVPLGDRTQVRSVMIGSGEITVDMVTHGPDDPMIRPTLEVIRKYRLEGDTLVESK